MANVPGPSGGPPRSGIIRTVDVARAAGVHENTVRLYVEWGFLAEPGRAANGYRLWTPGHIDQMIFARLAMHGLWPGRRIRESALSLVRLAATGDIAGAIGAALAHERLVDDEIARAEAAGSFLERWAAGEEREEPDAGAPPERPFGPREAAAAVCATREQVRNWERNRLVIARKDPATGRRSYGLEELGRLRVIRSLLLAGYSVVAVLRMTSELDRGRTTRLARALNTPRPGEEVLTAFDCWLYSLAEQKARAGRLVGMLEAMAGGAAARGASCESPRDGAAQPS